MHFIDFAKHSGFVYDVTYRDCWAQNGALMVVFYRPLNVYFSKEDEKSSE